MFTGNEAYKIEKENIIKDRDLSIRATYEYVSTAKEDKEAVYVISRANPPYRAFFDLKNKHIYKTKYIDILYEILRKYNYNFKTEIQDIIFNLGNLEDPSKNGEIIKDYLKGPYINDISFNGESFEILSSLYGKIKVYLLKERYKNNALISYYYNHGTIYHNCHGSSEYLADVFRKMSTISSKQPFQFYGSYYHSYTLDNETNEILNIHSNSIISKEEYDRIYEPSEIMCIPNNDLQKEIKKAEKNTNQDKNRFKVLKLALYKEYLNNKH